MSSILLSRLDLTQATNVQDARAGLAAAANDPTKLAVWAARWGDAFVALAMERAVREPSGYRSGARPS